MVSDSPNLVKIGYEAAFSGLLTVSVSGKMKLPVERREGCLTTKNPFLSVVVSPLGLPLLNCIGVVLER